MELQTRVIESDVRQHIEDTPLYGAIRDGKLVELPWNALEDWEQQEARNRMFDPNNCGW